MCKSFEMVEKKSCRSMLWIEVVVDGLRGKLELIGLENKGKITLIFVYTSFARVEMGVLLVLKW